MIAIIDAQELQALIQLLQRVPMTMAESIFVERLVKKLALSVEQSGESAISDPVGVGGFDPESLAILEKEIATDYAKEDQTDAIIPPLRPGPLSGY